MSRVCWASPPPPVSKTVPAHQLCKSSAVFKSHPIYPFTCPVHCASQPDLSQKSVPQSRTFNNKQQKALRIKDITRFLQVNCYQYQNYQHPIDLTAPQRSTFQLLIRQPFYLGGNHSKTGSAKLNQPKVFNIQQGLH